MSTHFFLGKSSSDKSWSIFDLTPKFLWDPTTDPRKNDNNNNNINNNNDSNNNNNNNS